MRVTLQDCDTQFCKHENYGILIRATDPRVAQINEKGDVLCIDVTTGDTIYVKPTDMVDEVVFATFSTEPL